MFKAETIVNKVGKKMCFLRAFSLVPVMLQTVDAQGKG